MDLLNELDIINAKYTMLEKINFMANEVLINIKKIILLATNLEDGYAAKYTIDSSLRVTYYIYRVATQKMVEQSLEIYDFTAVCCAKESMERYFTDLTYNMLEMLEK